MKKIKVGLLTHDSRLWVYDHLFCCKDLEIYALPSQHQSIQTNPYQLEILEQPDIVIVSSFTLLRIFRDALADEWENWLKNLRNKYTRLVLLECRDSFHIEIEPKYVQYFDLIIKPQGVYKDKELYNYKCGADFIQSKNGWTDKKRPKENKYSSVDLDKIRLSVPCFAAVIPQARKLIRKIKPGVPFHRILAANVADQALEQLVHLGQWLIKPRKKITFLGGTTHIDRINSMKLLKKNQVTGHYGLTNLLHYINGCEFPKALVPETELEQWRKELNENQLFKKSVNRYKYSLMQLQHEIIFSPSGFGEVCFRHGEALSLGRTLICQDLSHVDMLFDFKNHQNVLYCKPDFSDLMDCIYSKELSQIAKNGKKDWDNWTNNWEKLFYEGFTKHFQELMN